MLVYDDTLGTNAPNVKVITVDGKVTLRGAAANAAGQIFEKAGADDISYTEEASVSAAQKVAAR